MATHYGSANVVYLGMLETSLELGILGGRSVAFGGESVSVNAVIMQGASVLVMPMMLIVQ